MPELLTSALTVVLAGALSFTTALYVSRRATVRDQRIGFLLAAYRTLADGANRPFKEHTRAFEQAISDVGLLGEPEQVRLAAEFAIEMAANKRASLDPLLDSLRLGLRKELGLITDTARVPILRITPEPDQ